MNPKYGSALLLLSALVILCLAISSVEAQARFGEECIETQGNHPKRCEKGKAYVCDSAQRRCACAKGHYNKDQDRCVARMGDVCALQNNESPYVQCENANAFCDTTRGSPTYEKCICRQGEDCSAGFAVGPAAITTLIGLTATVLGARAMM